MQCLYTPTSIYNSQKIARRHAQGAPTGMTGEFRRQASGLMRQYFQPNCTPRDCWDMRMVSVAVATPKFLNSESPVTFCSGAYM